MFRIHATKRYLDELNKWPHELQVRAKKLMEKLPANPLLGKPLNYPFLREHKIDNRRIYCLVYEDLDIVLIIATSTKKNQQATIDYIKDCLVEFKSYARNL